MPNMDATIVTVPVGRDVTAYRGSAVSKAFVPSDVVSPANRGIFLYVEVGVDGWVDTNTNSGIRDREVSVLPGGALPDGITVQNVKQIMQTVFENKMAPSSEVRGEIEGAITILVYCDEGF